MYGAAAGAGASAIAAQEQALEETAADLKRQAEEGASRLGVPLTFVIVRGDPYTELRRGAGEMRAHPLLLGAPMQAGPPGVGAPGGPVGQAGRGAGPRGPQPP